MYYCNYEAMQWKSKWRKVWKLGSYSVVSVPGLTNEYAHLLGATPCGFANARLIAQEDVKTKAKP